MKTRSQSTKCVAPRKKKVQVTTPDNAPRVHKGLIRTPARQNLKTLFEQYRGKVPAKELFVPEFLLLRCCIPQNTCAAPSCHLSAYTESADEKCPAGGSPDPVAPQA